MTPAKSEAAEALAELRATYAEMFPHRNPEAMNVDDAGLALAVMLRREVRAAVAAMKVEPVAVPTFSLRGRIIDRLASYDPKDAE